MFYIGPGLLIALVLSIVMGGAHLKEETERRRAASAPPIVESQVAAGEQDALGPVPDVKFLLDRSKGLGLGEEQIRRLRSIQSEWEGYSAPKMKRANEAAGRVGDYLLRSKGNKKTPVAQIQQEAAPVVSVSGELSASRHRFWERAVTVLTGEQRKAVDQARREDYAARQKALRRALGR